jgi:hypothetical protein
MPACQRSALLTLFGAIFGAALVGGSDGSRPALGAERAPKSKGLLIVAPHAFHQALAPYVAHKKRLLPTQFVALEAVVKQTNGVDDAEKLKRYLYGRWKKDALGYVLLVGDVDVMPVRYMVLDRVTPAAFDYAFYPSDLYYADLAKQDGRFEDWNARKEGFHARYFGEVRGEKNKHDPINYDQVDYRPEIAVGRWPVSTAAEVRLVAAKSMAYENSVRAGTHPGEGRAEFFHGGGYIDARDRLDQLVRRMPAGWRSDRYFFGGGDKRYHTPPLDEKHVLAALNRGAALVVHVGHGGDTVWDGCFSTGSLATLTNADRLPVLFSVGCGTAYFAPLAPYDGYVDVHGKRHAGTNNKEVFTAPPPAPALYQRGRYNPTGLGEQALKHGPGGAVIYIGCNTGAQPCAFTLLEGFLLAMQQPERPLAGDCWASAVRHYYDKERLAALVPNGDWYPPSIFFQGMKFMFFGDPTLPFAHPR